jgi:hypothetical protein
VEKASDIAKAEHRKASEADARKVDVSDAERSKPQAKRA